MKPAVLCSILCNDEISRIIMSMAFIFVMNFFARDWASTQDSVCLQSVFVGITTTISQWVLFANVNKDITSRVHYATAFPIVRMFFCHVCALWIHSDRTVMIT